MSYTIEMVDFNEPAIELELRELIKAAFKTSDLVPQSRLITNISSNASQPSFFLAAKEDGKIIGCNGFIANDFYVNGKQYIGYQSCWTATHPDHQGRRIFINLINEAKKILKDKEAGFLFGLGNNASHPILIKKLDFIETPAMLSRIPRIPFFRSLYLNEIKTDHKSTCFIDEEQLMKHKLAQFPSDVKLVRYNNSWLWGKYRSKLKFGIRINFFEIGGVQLAKEQDLGLLLKEIFRIYKVWFVQIISCKTNSFNVLIKNWKPASMNGFILYNLNAPDFEHFNMMIGAIDVY